MSCKEWNHCWFYEDVFVILDTLYFYYTAQIWSHENKTKYESWAYAKLLLQRNGKSQTISIHNA